MVRSELVHPELRSAGVVFVHPERCGPFRWCGCLSRNAVVRFEGEGHQHSLADPKDLMAKLGYSSSSWQIQELGTLGKFKGSHFWLEFYLAWRTGRRRRPVLATEDPEKIFFGGRRMPMIMVLSRAIGVDLLAAA